MKQVTDREAVVNQFGGSNRRRALETMERSEWIQRATKQTKAYFRWWYRFGVACAIVADRGTLKSRNERSNLRVGP
jgi:hypothetical protein